MRRITRVALLLMLGVLVVSCLRLGLWPAIGGSSLKLSRFCARSQTITVPDKSIDARNLLSGAKAKALMESECPNKVASRIPLSGFHNITV